VRKLKGGIRPVVKVRDLTELKVADLWKEVKSEEEWWEDINERILGMVRTILESSLESELLEQLQASPYQRTEVRKGYRNGYYERDLYSQYGVIKALRIPRARDGFVTQIVPHYQRNLTKVNQMVRNIFLAGVSTRRVGEVLSNLWDREVSAQTVSRICQSLDREVAAYHHRILGDNYVYLFFDGISIKVKGATQVHKKQILVAYGITMAGKKEIIEFRQSTAESANQWEGLLRDMYQRGLHGQNCRLITTDGCPGLHQALEIVYPYIPKQRCWAHKLRNVASRVRRKDQTECLSAAKKIYLAENRREAVKGFKSWKETWGKNYPEAIQCLEKDLDELLNFLDCPPVHRVKIRTTNVIERSFREVRRRTRTISCFTNGPSVDRIIFGVISHLNKTWKDKPILKFTQLS
jgi:putative transposase